MLNTPILFIIFNRPDTTAKVWDKIKEAKPSQLFIAADGARAHKTGEAALVARTRQIVENIDWQCDVKTLFRDENLGCKQAVSGAINWFFENVEQGIILEDDCLPHSSFFSYCEELLNKYKDDERIMMISGDNFQRGQSRTHYSYYFSRYAHIWGWATWRRAWKLYDASLSTFAEFKAQNLIADLFTNPNEQKFWLDNFESVYSGGNDTWDFQWVYTMLTQHGLSATPNVNLISNIGFGSGATHTTNADDGFANMPTFDIGDLHHPQLMIVNKQADAYNALSTFGIQFDRPKVISYLSKTKQKIRKLLV